MESDLKERMAEAYLLSEIVPPGMPRPDVIQDDDGDLAFEWYADKHNQVQIWMRDRLVSYAGMVDGKSSHGRTSELVKIPEPCIVMMRMVADKMRAGQTVSGEP